MGDACAAGVLRMCVFVRSELKDLGLREVVLLVDHLYLAKCSVLVFQ